MFRALLWLGFMAAWVVVVDAIARPHVDAVMLAGGGVTVILAGLMLLGDGDVLADHPEEERERELEERRRRGGAGWQKPVAPPSRDSRPGGLPPRRGR